MTNSFIAKYQNPIVAAPILGATKIQHIEEAANSTVIHLTEVEIKTIETSYQVNKVMPWNL